MVRRTLIKWGAGSNPAALFIIFKIRVKNMLYNRENKKRVRRVILTTRKAKNFPYFIFGGIL